MIHRRFTVIEETPIQSAAVADEPGEIEIFDDYLAGLADIEGFGFSMVLTQSHLATQVRLEARLEVRPFLDT